ncbi:MAG TPA: hypothetical protein VF458_17740 [Ktedonobacteraceae bacterium]
MKFSILPYFYMSTQIPVEIIRDVSSRKTKLRLRGVWLWPDYTSPVNWYQWKKRLCFPYLLPRKKQLYFGRRLRAVVFACLQRKDWCYFSYLLCQR